MRKFLLTISLALCAMTAFAQHIVPGTYSLEKSKKMGMATYVLQYALKFKYSRNQTKYDVDDRVVQIGERLIKDYSRIVYYYDSLRTENNRKGLDSPVNQNIVFPYELLIDKKVGKCNVKYRLPLNGGTLCYSSEQPRLEWTFVPDSALTLLGYSCGMAKTHFAGRDYVAWYTLDLPIPYGPYKFSGLPGLIMKVEDASRQFCWELVGVRSEDSPIMLYTYEGEQKCSEQDAKKTIRRAQRNPIRFLEQIGRNMMFQSADGRVRPSTAIPNIPDNNFEPLEQN